MLPLPNPLPYIFPVSTLRRFYDAQLTVTPLGGAAVRVSAFVPPLAAGRGSFILEVRLV